MALQLTAHATQDMFIRHCNDFIAKREWPPNSPYFNVLDYHVWGAMLKDYHKLDITCWTSQPSTVKERRTRLEMIWNDLPRKPVAQAVDNFRKRLQACMFKAGGHFEHFM